MKLDREKVIKDLHDIAGFIAGRVGIEQARNFLRTIDDTVVLLKEQVQKETPMTMERINVVKVDGNDFYKGFCHACQTLQYGIKSKYCDQCGQAVKWNA